MESSPGSRWEDMEEAPVTAATGGLGPVIAKLAALLGSEYKLQRRTRRDVKLIRSKLRPVHSILWNIWERDVLDEASKALKMEALDLADDVDDAIVNFINLSLERSISNNRLIQTKNKERPFEDFKKRASDVSGRCRSKWKKPLSCGKIATDDSRPGKARVYPFVRKDASELVGMVEQRDKLIRHLVGEDERTPVELQLKKASIFGLAGMGKTTLADLVYQAIGSKFQSRAFVSITPGGNMREVLARILEQVAENSVVPVAGTQAATEEEHLIDIISNFLKDKRYLVIIDDILNWRDWEVIMKSLPENSLGSRIMGTSRIKTIADSWSYGPNACLVHEMVLRWDSGKGWVYGFGENNIVTGMVSMKADLVAEGFDYKHPIVRMCGGMPLAVLCMFSAVAQEREKQGQHANARDLQDEIEKHILGNGIQNTRGFEPLVESFQLGYDDLPHHMLRTCLLYCSIYPAEGIAFGKYDLVRRWISEGLVCKEEEANRYFEELVNRGLILCRSASGDVRMHPMMHNFLRWKSRQDNFTICSSQITSSYNSTCRVRRLLISSSIDAAVDPLSLVDWYHIRSLVVYEAGRKRVPFEKLEGLRLLDLCWNIHILNHDLKDIGGLVRLRHLLGFDVFHRISEVPSEIGRLQCLETFEAKRLPGFIGSLKQLKTLEVIGGKITKLPRGMEALKNLQTLRIRNTRIVELPLEIWSLKQLKTLDIRHSEITKLPRGVEALKQLKTLRMIGQKITELPLEIGALQQLETLDMSCSSITELPKEIGSLQQLKSLYMSCTKITALPKEISKLQQLKTLDISYTPMTTLPKEVGKLQHLEDLLMTGTDLAKIPKEIGALNELKSLKLDRSITVAFTSYSA